METLIEKYHSKDKDITKEILNMIKQLVEYNILETNTLMSVKERKKFEKRLKIFLNYVGRYLLDYLLVLVLDMLDMLMIEL